LAWGARHHGRDNSSVETICNWAQGREIDVVVWTDLPSNFLEVCRTPFSVDTAMSHIASLPPEGKAKAAEYVWRAPDFIETPLRTALQAQPWFSRPS